MKNILLILMLAICAPALADVYVITAPDKTIVSVSESDDAVVPAGYSKDIVKNKMIGDLPIDGDVSLYKFSGNKFTLDSKKVADKRKADEETALEIEERKANRASAIEKLKAIGLSESEIIALIGG
jgi:hypothetical protein